MTNHHGYLVLRHVRDMIRYDKIDCYDMVGFSSYPVQTRLLQCTATYMDKHSSRSVSDIELDLPHVEFQKVCNHENSIRGML